MNPVYSVSIASFVCLLVVFFCTLASIIALSEKKVQARIKAAQINMFWTSFCFSITTSFVMIYMVVLDKTLSQWPDIGGTISVREQCRCFDASLHCQRWVEESERQKEREIEIQRDKETEWRSDIKIVRQRDWICSGWMYDLNCLSPAWMLFITNKRLRSTLTKKSTQTIVRPIASSQNTQ